MEKHEQLLLTREFWEEVWMCASSPERLEKTSVEELGQMSSVLSIMAARVDRAKVARVKAEKERQQARADVWKYFGAGKKSIAQALCAEYDLVLDEIVQEYRQAGQKPPVTGTPRECRSTGEKSKWYVALPSGDRAVLANRYNVVRKVMDAVGVRIEDISVKDFQALHGIEPNQPFEIDGKSFTIGPDVG